MNIAIALAVVAAAPGGMTEEPPQKRMALPYYTSRVAKTPDINQHMTWEQMLGQIPARLRKKYTPPAEIGIKSRVFYKNFCGPCAVADNLLYLRKDFPQIGDHSNSVVSGTFLARNLGSNFFDTLTNPSDEDFDPMVGGGTRALYSSQTLRNSWSSSNWRKTVVRRRARRMRYVIELESLPPILSAF